MLNPITNKMLMALLLVVSTVGCTSHKTAKQPTYGEAVMSRPQPPNDEARMSECAWLMSEIHRQQSGLGYASSLEAGSPKREEVMRTVYSNIAVLEARARNAGCGASSVTTMPFR
jgi:hypothetical protein